MSISHQKLDNNIFKFYSCSALIIQKIDYFQSTYIPPYNNLSYTILHNNYISNNPLHTHSYKQAPLIYKIKKQNNPVTSNHFHILSLYYSCNFKSPHLNFYSYRLFIYSYSFNNLFKTFCLLFITYSDIHSKSISPFFVGNNILEVLNFLSTSLTNPDNK